ncbi:hypothetical protein [Kineococcus sp. SYSU DK018]|uniref:hypothetical protein n=1 Tax=Kineococcus sp. SYSU DK018 TaxID=3383139 RepID=UPI003D7E008C
MLKSEVVAGTSRAGTAYRFHRVRILTPSADVYDARIGSDPQPVPAPQAGEVVDYDVALSVYRDQVQVAITGFAADLAPIAVGA